MAISHIPRSVGHNFTPEYQISGVPYVTSTALSVTKRIVVREADGLVVGTMPHTEGSSITTNGVLPDAEIFTDVNIKTKAGLKNEFEVILKLELPKITKWIIFKSGAAASMLYFLCRKEAALGSNSNSIIRVDRTFKGVNTSSQDVFERGETLPLNLRLVNIYMIDGAANNAQIIAGLTTIDRSEFTEVVEKFYGDITAEDL